MNVRTAVQAVAPLSTGLKPERIGMNERKQYPIEWDNEMKAYFFWDEAEEKQGYWENRDDAEVAYEEYSFELLGYDAFGYYHD